MIVRSLDGTPIHAEAYGEGSPALVVVPGALSTQGPWESAAQLLAAGRKVLVLDRRGRGQSGDAPEYTPEREVEDVLAFVEELGQPTDLLGHSSGAILAIQVAQRAPSDLRRLVLYEPPVYFADGDRVPADLPERLEALLATGDRDAALEVFLREGPRVPEEQLIAMRADPAWPVRAGMAHTVAREARIQRGFDPVPKQLRRVHVPTLMLIGEESPHRMRAGAEGIAARIPNCATRILHGQQHSGMRTDPTAFSEIVDGFLRPSTT
jgi:pimeloyl-ACP methyl ester carboxylesterase